MFPIRDHNPSRRIPYVTYALIAINVVVFLYGLAFLQTNEDIGRLYANYAMIPANITAGEKYPTLITSIFLHAGFMHIAGNMLFLWIYGDNMEDEMGHAPFLAFYLVTGVAASYAQIIADPSSPIPTVGASGAIAGVMGGYLLLFPKARVDILLFLVVFIRVFPIPAWIVLGIWFGLQLINGVGVSTEGGGVAYWAHAGGFVAGLLLTIPLWLRLGATRFWERTHGHPPHPETSYPRINSRIPNVKRK